MLIPSPQQRLSVRHRPQHRVPIMFQRWENLLFLHWEVDPEVVRQSLPAGLSVDCHEGKAYIGIVPFFMRRVRFRGLPSLPYISNFLECNVRTYVHDESGTPGVWFYSLDTDRWLAHKAARLAFHLPYFWASIRARVDESVSYRVRRRFAGVNTVHYACKCSADTVAAEPGSLEFFLLERYLFFSHSSRKERLYSGRVHHDPYRFSHEGLDGWDVGPASWNGIVMPDDDAAHACVAEPVDVEVFALQRLR